MTTNNTLFQFDNYIPNVFPVRSPLLTTPYEQYPYLELPSKPKPTSEGQFEDFAITCNTYQQDVPVYLPCTYNTLGDERYGIPEQEQPLDMCTDMLPSHPWLHKGRRIKLVLNSVSNVARQYDLTIGDELEVEFLTRADALLILKHKTVPIHYVWDRSVSTGIAFFTLQFPGFVFNDLTFELRASSPNYGTAYSPLGFANYEMNHRYCTSTQLLPHSTYSITKL